MKKSTVLLAASLAVCGAASAQSSVNLYGSIDQSVAHVSNLNGGSVTNLYGGTTQPDRIGFRGVEDLGGGMQANFWLEGGIAPQTGAQINPTALFNRNATVGLAGAFGSLTLGNQGDLMFDWVGKTSNGYQLQNFFAFHPGNFDNLAETFAYNNAVRYNTPTWGGLTLGAVYGFNSAAPGAPTNRNTSVGANYVQGPLRVAAAYSEQDHRVLRGFAPFAAASGLPATGAMDKVTNAGIGVAYRFASFGVNAAYAQSKLEAGTVSATMRNLDLGLSYHLAPATTLNAGYSRSKLLSSSWNTYSLMAMYHFSKRTQAYVQGTFQQASQGQLALLNGVGPSSDSHQNIVGIGMHHSF
ncbi:MAG: Outer membrane protein (porin) [Burkholderiaceae bacterium]|jgi:predicted porin|nr:MAG: Outer membrane protein (porin) [Burkholderiaceae bacterium]